MVPGTELNYAEHVFRHAPYRKDKPAILHQSEVRPLGEVSWAELQEKTAALAAGLREMGVGRGDRVAAYLPNIPEAVIALLACASIGAVWSSCSPDFGAGSVVDRFEQIEPKVLLAVDGYRYGGKDYDRIDVVAKLQDEIPTLQKSVVLPYLSGDPDTSALETVVMWDDLLAGHQGAELAFEQVPFDHPLWVLYSSGTTGLPKAIVHSQGGILIEHLKKVVLHIDLGPDDRLFWFTTTGWMMWNLVVAGLLTGSTILLYDGNPGYPDMNVLWEFAEKTGMTCFGTSASYITACMKAGHRAEEGLRPDEPEVDRVDGLAAAARGFRVGLRACQGGPLALLHQRRHRPVHRVRRRGYRSCPSAQGSYRPVPWGRKSRPSTRRETHR